MHEKDSRFLKISTSIIGLLLTICGILILIGFSAHSDADLQDRMEIKGLSIQASKTEIGLLEMKDDIKSIKQDIGDIKVYIFTGEWP